MRRSERASAALSDRSSVSFVGLAPAWRSRLPYRGADVELANDAHHLKASLDLAGEPVSPRAWIRSTPTAGTRPGSRPRRAAPSRRSAGVIHRRTINLVEARWVAISGRRATNRIGVRLPRARRAIPKPKAAPSRPPEGRLATARQGGPTMLSHARGTAAQTRPRAGQDRPMGASTAIRLAARSTVPGEGESPARSRKLCLTFRQCMVGDNGAGSDRGRGPGQSRHRR
jgi:hypothetical protein